MDDLLREFLTETGEHLDTVDVELVRFEQDPNNESILRNIFRLVHTIKGTCGFLGLSRLEAVAHAAKSLEGGVTTLRDLGTEGLENYDVQLKRAINRGVIPGPRLITTTRALVATGSYAPRRSTYSFDPPQGAEEATGVEGVARAVRSQIGLGADWIKVYSDFSWGPNGKALPTFGDAELRSIVETARDAGRPVAAHAMTPEGIRRAVNAGVETIEHGDEGTPEVFRLMKAKGVALCPTLATAEAYETYFSGWIKGKMPRNAELVKKQKSFKAALEAGQVPGHAQAQRIPERVAAGHAHVSVGWPRRVHSV